jgi:acetyl esterase/lipase
MHSAANVLMPAPHPILRISLIVLLQLAASWFIAGCEPSPTANVIAYQIEKRLGTLPPEPVDAPPGGLTGVVRYRGAPVEGAAVVVADRIGNPFAAFSDANGHYHIPGIPPGQYVPAAVAPGFEETVPRDLLGIPFMVTIESHAVTEAPVIQMLPRVPPPLPVNLAQAVQLQHLASYTATTNFPPGATAGVTAYAFYHQGEQVDTLRLYTPPEAVGPLPLLFMVFPTHVDAWESVSVAFASQGFAFLAISPIAAREVDIDAHAQDARVGLALARAGALAFELSPAPAVALGGSFSSPILHRLLRDEGEHFAAWVTVGGISNAFSGAADFYRGQLYFPPEYELAIPALGPANLFPLAFLRYSPVYTAAQLPPTKIVHTVVDQVTPITQAYQLEAALRAANVPVEVFYYEDVSHYLQIGDDLTEAGAEMFWRILRFIEEHLPRQSM